MRTSIGIAIVFLAGCPSKDEHAPAPGVMPDAAPIASISAAPAASGPVKPLPCRAIAVAGKITDTDGGASLSLGGQLPDSIFALDDAAKMTVKDPASGREVTFEGAATVRTCVAGDPEHWLLKGGFSATPGAGEKPGSEEWVITPFGIVRFASAMVKIRVEKDRVTVRVSSGSVSIYAPKLTAPDGGAPPTAEWTDATPAAPLDLLSPGPPKKLVDACAAVAKTARELGAQLVSPDASIGDLAPKHLEARRKARASCALARVSALSAGGDSALFMRAEAADAEWRIVAR